MQVFVSPQFKATLEQHQWHDFEPLWHYPIDWFEAPNERRGGWSGVGCVTLNQGTPNALKLFVKKQANHGRRTWRHPFRGEPTFKREFARLQFLAQHQVNVPQVAFYGEQNQAQQRAILVTLALDSQPLDTLMTAWWQLASPLQQAGLIEAVASAVRRLHDLGLTHRALYPKHIFVKHHAQQPEIAFIDLEKARFTPFLWRRTLFDLAALHRHTPWLRRTQRLHFLLHYLKVPRLNRLNKCLCRLLLKRATR